MSINQIRAFRNYQVQRRPIINTMEVQHKLAEKQPVTVAEKRKIIEEPDKKDKSVNSIEEIIKEKPSKKEVRKFFKNRVFMINEKLEDIF